MNEKLEALKQLVETRRDEHAVSISITYTHESDFMRSAAKDECSYVLAEIDRLLAEPAPVEKENITERAKRLGFELSKVKPLSESELAVITGKSFAEDIRPLTKAEEEQTYADSQGQHEDDGENPR